MCGIVGLDILCKEVCSDGWFAWRFCLWRHCCCACCYCFCPSMVNLSAEEEVIHYLKRRLYSRFLFLYVGSVECGDVGVYEGAG